MLHIFSHSLVNFIRHHFNSLHIYGKLIWLGVPERRARVFARKYERIVHPLLYLNIALRGWTLIVKTIRPVNLYRRKS